jgi:hexokinase
MTDSLKTRIQDALREVNFYSVIDALPEIAQQGRTMAINAGRNIKPAFEAFPSYIPAEDRIAECSCLLAIDIGGTSTKAAIRTCNHGTPNWKLLFELKNLDLKEVEFKENAFDAFCKILANHVERGLVSAGVPKEDVAACGIVWSNAMENIALPNVGITGKVVQIEKYQKGEWFNAGLENGRDLGEDFLMALSRRKLKIDKLLISNDTPLTLKATPGAAAGMVASTGLNTTLLKSAKELGLGAGAELMICNSEMGGRFILDPKYLCPLDKLSETQSASTVENLTTGNFLPLLFTSYIFNCQRLNLPELANLREYLMTLENKAWEEFRSRDLSLLLSDQSFFLRRHTKRSLYTPEVLACLTSLTEELIERSAILCAMIAAISVSNLEQREEPYLISLDSRLAREIPAFWSKMQSEIVTQNYFNQKIQLNLVHPIELANGKISVPMIGAANGIDSLG